MFLTKDITLLAFRIRYTRLPDRHAGLHPPDVRTLHAQGVIVPPSRPGLAKHGLCIQRAAEMQPTFGHFEAGVFRIFGLWME